MVWYSRRDPAAKKIKKVIVIPGVHNISNAMAVSWLGMFLEIPGIENPRCDPWLSWRVAEDGTARKIQRRAVYDDYAHHPTEIAATLQAFREKFPKKKILCVFQPHQAKRLALLFKEFQAAFDAADETLILPLYKVAGRDEFIPNRDSEALVRAIQKKQPRKPIFYLADPAKLKDAILSLRATLLRRKVIVMMGAGDIVKLTEKLLQ